MRRVGGQEVSGTAGFRITEEGPAPPWIPRFDRDPIVWLQAVRRWRLGPTWMRVVATLDPGEWISTAGHRWRMLRTVRGVEIRPDLVAPFLHFGSFPIVTALGIGVAVEVELTTESFRWVDVFAPEQFDFAELGRAMLEERQLPHDNLPLLFPAR
ncbi:MAG TPA: hypothetical protein VFV59_04610 [Candidatus Limnocylindria bacterium]|nr:hypothetical protein [Candidatus Limnocylindria bacterium]